MKSIGQIIQTVAGLADTKDVTHRENDFLKDMVRFTHNGKYTQSLTEKQVKWLTDIHDRHFARSE
jgi:hypothetical protein